MARSVRQAQRSVEPCAISRLLLSIVYVDMQQEAPLETGIVVPGPLATPEPARRITVPVVQPSVPVVQPSIDEAPALTAEAPRYDAIRRELWYMGVLIKKLRSSARNQKSVFACWQEQNWEGPLFDPLKPNGTSDPHKRFLDTVEDLNACHVNPGWLEFVPDGGEQVSWTSGPQAIALLTQRGRQMVG